MLGMTIAPGVAGRFTRDSGNSLYGTLPYTARRTGTDHWAVYDQYAGIVHSLDDLSAQVLSLCEGGRSLDEHVLFVAATCPSVDSAVVRTVVRDLIARGLLCRVEWWPKGGRVSGPRVREPTVGVVTADRPKALRRCLRHLLRHCQRFGRVPEVVVVDGSREPRNCVLNRRFVQRWRSQTGAPCKYVGDPEKRNLRRALADRGIDSELLDFGLFGGAGANRNVLTLLTAGGTLVMVDDDVICQPWTLPSADGRLVLGGHGDQHDHAFHETREGAMSCLMESDVDVCRAHTGLLGRTLIDLVEERTDRLDLRDACGHLLRWLHARDRAVVRLTFTGVAGDSGAWCPYQMLFTPAPAVRQCFANEVHFATALSSREVRRGVRSETITDGSWCMAYCMGLDNRVLVPPFMPSGRNQDGVFGVMMKRLDATNLSAHLPFGIIHDSDRPSRYSPTIRWASCTRLCDFILALLRQRQWQSTSREAGLEHLGRIFAEIGSATASDFMSFTMHAALDDRCEALALADATKADLPGYWSAAVDRCRQRLIESAAEPDFFLASDLATTGAVEKRRRDLQRFIRQFGRLTSTWPEITAAARSLDTRSLEIVHS